MTRPHLLCLALASAFAAVDGAVAQSVSGVSFVNGLAIDGALPDLTTGAAFDRRVGFFSDLYYDANRREWWGLSDRGPGGGTLPYDTRVQRFTLDVGADGRIGHFAVAQTVVFKQARIPMNGIAPNPANQLGRARRQNTTRPSEFKLRHRSLASIPFRSTFAEEPRSGTNRRGRRNVCFGSRKTQGPATIANRHGARRRRRRFVPLPRFDRNT